MVLPELSRDNGLLRCPSPWRLSFSLAGLTSKISPAPTMFSVPVPLPAENFDDGSTEEPEHPDMKENPLKESAPFLQEWSSYNEPEKQPHIS
ncbi:hypothetical protein ZWY2020_014941 [Hordeum vulgare]|nr:hypothetical protein ZWY2020_014941 [Hordeum vulgare]